MVYYLLSETLGFTYGVEDDETSVPEGAVVFPNEEALDLAVARAEKDVEEEFAEFQKVADEGIDDGGDGGGGDGGGGDDFKREERVQQIIDNESSTPNNERRVINDLLDKKSVKEIIDGHRRNVIESLAGRLGVQNRERLSDEDLVAELYLLFWGVKG